ncbi:MAG: hypothetical protein ACKOC1_07360 [Hyphomicrobiales bacterium]
MNIRSRFGLTLVLLGGVIATNSDQARAEDDMFGSILGAIGLTSNAPEIEYRERSPLVVPPKIKLPKPKDTASANSAAWPIDPDIERKKAAEAEANAPWVDPGKRLSIQEIRAGRRPGAGIESDYNPVGNRKDPKLSIEEMTQINASLKAYNASNLQASASTERQWLTDPPNIYRKPATITPEIEAQAIAAGAKTDKPWYQFW